MTYGAFRNALQRTYAEHSYFGLQILDLQLREQFIATVERGMAVYYQLQTVTEMADQLRDHLKRTWRSTQSCREDRTRCVNRICPCSYADYLSYRGLRATQARLERRFSNLAREAYEIRATWQYVLRPVSARLLENR